MVITKDELSLILRIVGKAFTDIGRELETKKEIKLYARDINCLYQDNIKEIVEFLNEVTSKTFKPGSKSTILKIKARFKEDYTIEDFKKVIRFKSEEWSSDPNMSRYLRPETLFSNKFESYLIEARQREVFTKELETLCAKNIMDGEPEWIMKRYKS